jgi:hypothetical protein
LGVCYKDGIGVQQNKSSAFGSMTEVINECPCCKHPDESSSHITHCRNEGQQKIFHESGKQLTAWHTTHMDEGLVRAIHEYLLMHGEG